MHDNFIRDNAIHASPRVQESRCWIKRSCEILQETLMICGVLSLRKCQELVKKCPNSS